MATHRRVKNIDYDHDESGFEDDLETGYEEYNEDDATHEVSEEDKQRMQNGIVEVQKSLGPACQATTTEIADTLWYYYYDVSKSVAYLREKYAPRAKKPDKAPSKFEQAASRASKNVDKRPKIKAPPRHPYPWHAVAEQLEALGPNSPNLYSRNSQLITTALFQDVPWLNVPAHRVGTIHCEPRYKPARLLGGSSSSATKPSKLAQLAAARKKAAEERQKTATARPQTAESKVSISRGQDLIREHFVKAKADKVGRSAAQSNSELEHSIVFESSCPSNQSDPHTEGSLHDKSWEDPSERRSYTSKSCYQRVRTSEELKAAPSPFARTILGNFKFTNPSLAHVPSQLSSLPVLIHENNSNFEAFTVPSPDDKVLTAQSKGSHGNNKSNDVSGEATNEVAALKVEEPPTRAKSKGLDVVAEFERSNSKTAVNFVVIGHVDHGKSTLMGRLLYDLGVVDQRSVERLRKEADSMKKSSFALAWVMDSTSEERQRGVTVDVATNHFETAKNRFTILDAPGHQDFIPNMIAGASQADFAVLVIDAGTNAFESGLRGQTKEHIQLARSLGIGRIIVAVNKMDTVSWSEQRFNTIREQMSAFFTKQGFISKNISFVPCAGLTGENVAKPPEDGQMLWFTNGTLVDELDRSEPTKRAITNPLRMTISNIFRDSVQNPLSISGRIEGGSLQIGETILAMPANEKAVIKGIEVENARQDWAVAGQIATLHLSEIDPIHLRLGDVVCHPDQRPIKNTTSFTAKILAFDHVTPMYIDVYKGRMQAPARISALVAVLDKQNGEVTKKKPRIIQPGEVARMRVDLEGSVLPLEAPSRVVFRTGGKTIAAGLVENVR